jgi:hypothetical protein
VNSAVPIIYCRMAAPAVLTWRGRWAAALLGCGCLAMLVTAALLAPDPSGSGTHTQLGLAPCQFKLRTGLPCPSCGMTTSFTYFARGNLLASLYLQPMGMMLALLTAAGVWVGFYVAAAGRPVYRLLRFVPTGYYLIPLMAWAVGAWGWKIMLTLGKMDGWR